MPSQYINTKDINGYINANDYGLPFTKINYAVNLATNVAASFTVPANDGKFLAVFKYASTAINLPVVYVDPYQTAVQTTLSTFVTTTATLNPSARIVSPGDVISFITPGGTNRIVVTLYSLPKNSN